MTRVILLLLLNVITWIVFGQTGDGLSNKVLEDLNRQLKMAESDTARALVYIRIAETFEYSNPDSTYYYSEKAFQLAKAENNIPIQMGAMSFMAYAYLRNGNLPKALELGLEAIKLGKDLPVMVAGGVGPVYSVLGELYIEIGDYDNAMTYFHKMAGLGDKDLVGVAYGTFYLAMIHEKLNQLDSASLYLHQSYEIFGKLDYSYYPDVYHVYPPWYNLRAKIYLKQAQPALAIKDLYRSLEMTEQNGDVFHICNTCIDIASFYQNFNQTDSAVYYAEKSIQEANKINYTQGVLFASELLSALYEPTDPAKALFYFKLAKENRDSLYGNGNIEIMRDMIAQEEKRLTEIEATKAAYQNRIRMNAILGATFTLFIAAVFLFILIRRKQKAKQKIEIAYDKLKSAQSQLIHAEKMASLGELTAGIAHEIQNPLNFINNFSEVNRELISELKEEMVGGDPDEVKAIADDIAQNEEKISYHGKRADGIVKGMLQHSRSSNGHKEPTDINALADEYLRLAYHGLRAKDKSFNAEFHAELDKSLPKIKVIGQDIGRVLLNLINNAFFAVSEKKKTAPEDYKPSVSLSTKRMDHVAEIRVKDNGNGIPDSVKDKIFQPFFTTKPTGEGTGLGLSMSYDIITKGHGGDLKVESREGEGTTFIIQIPVQKTSRQ